MPNIESENDKLNEALQYAQLHWKIFPLHRIKNGKCSCGKDDCDSPGKHPLTCNGFKNATTDPEIILRWWGKHREANIGVATGKESGFFVLDVDLPGGAKSLASLEEQQGKLPETVEQSTGSGGRHLLFKVPAGEEIKGSISKIGLNLDIKGEGGYIVVAPSGHVSGNPYAWRPGHGLDEIEMAEAPQWLIDLTKFKPKPRKRDLLQSVSLPQTAETTPYGQAALEGEIQALAGIPEGQRNDALNRSSFKVGQLVASGEISLSQAENALEIAGEQMGLTSREIQATVKSGLQKGMENPRTPRETSSSVTVSDKSEPPRPLVREIPPGGEYPVKALGPLLGDAVRAIAASIQVPPALAAGSVLAVASLAVQGIADVLLPIVGGYARPLSLYVITIAESSDRKSTSDSFALRAVKKYEQQVEIIWEKDMDVYMQKKLAYEKTRDATIKNNLNKMKNSSSQAVTNVSHEISELGDPPLPPLIPYLTVQEPTIEALLKLLSLGRASLGLFTAEGGQMIGGYSMQKDHKLNSFAVLSSLWDADPIKRIRVIEGYSSLRGKRFALHLMLQPIVASRVISDPEIAGQGLLSRMLVAAPGSLAGTRFFRKAEQSSLDAINRFEERIYEILSKPLPVAGNTRNELRPSELSLSPAAEGIWISFYNEMEKSIRPKGKFEQVKAFVGKLAEQAARIAGILTLIKNLKATEISSQVMESACQLARFYAEEALRLFNLGQISRAYAEAQELLEWLHSRGEELICLPDIYQLGPNSIRTQANAKEKVKILEEHGWLNPLPNGVEIQGKFRREVWRIVKP